MFSDEIVSGNLCIRLDCVRLRSGKAGCIGLAHRIAQMYLFAEARRQGMVDTALGDVAQGGSSRSVAYLKGARLERSQECQRRGGKNELLLQAYARRSLRACNRGSIFAAFRRVPRFVAWFVTCRLNEAC
jgi:hypothetical protein